MPEQSTPQGPGTSGGGEILDAAFKKTGRKVFAYIDTMNPDFINTFDINFRLLANLLEKAKVTGSSKKLFDSKGQERDFINDYTNQSIKGYLPAWSEACQPLKDLIVLHEVIGLTRTSKAPESKDENYVISQQIVEKYYGNDIWGSNCSPKSFVSVTSKDILDTNVPAGVTFNKEDFLGVWVGKLKRQGIGEDPSKVYDCFDDASTSDYSQLDYNIVLAIEDIDGQLSITQSLWCDLDVDSDELVLGTRNPHSGEKAISYIGDSELYSVDSSMLFINTGTKPLHIGIASYNLIKINFNDFFKRDLVLSEDKEVLEFTEETSYDKRSGYHKSFSKLIRLDKISQGEVKNFKLPRIQ